MTTRRELLKDGIGISVILAARHAPAIVKSIIGARQTQLDTNASTYSAASYVQDGLLAMWDGTENAKLGIHDDSATIWKDLVGSRDFIIRDPNNVHFEPNAYSSDYQTTGINVDTLTTGSFMFADNLALTFEISGKIRSYIKDNTATIFSSCIWNSGWNIPTFYLQPSACSILRYKFGYSSGRPFEAGSSFSVSCVHSNRSNIKVKINGILVNQIGSAPWSIGAKTITRIGYDTNDKPFNGLIYNARIYSRRLTDVEVAHNYQIDKVRFGL